MCNFNALKPKNNQTHSVSQTSLQSTGVTTAASTKSPPTVDKSNKCHLLQCSYANLPANASQKDQQTSSNNHGTIMFRDQRCEKKVLSSRAGPLGTIPRLLAAVYSLVYVFKICCYGCLGRKERWKDGKTQENTETQLKIILDAFSFSANASKLCISKCYLLFIRRFFWSLSLFLLYL